MEKSMKSLHNFIAFASMAALVGCGGGGTDQPDENSPLAEFFGIYGGDVDGDYDADLDQFTITSDGATVTGVFVRDATYDKNGFAAYRYEDKFLFFAVSADGETIAALAFHDFDTFGDYTGAVAFADAGYARDAGTVLPTSGTAKFYGDYIGVIQHNAESYLDSYVAGDVTLDASFSAMTISGVIDNRVTYDPFDALDYGEVVQDVMLNSTAITSNGTYAGTTSGGATDYLDNELSSNHAGVYQGAFGGATGGDTAGAVQIDHDLTGLVGLESGEMYTEFGAFIASR
jgi:hypothetical protein